MTTEGHVMITMILFLRLLIKLMFVYLHCYPAWYSRDIVLAFSSSIIYGLYSYSYVPCKVPRCIVKFLTTTKILIWILKKNIFVFRVVVIAFAINSNYFWQNKSHNNRASNLPVPTRCSVWMALILNRFLLFGLTRTEYKVQIN